MKYQFHWVMYIECKTFRSHTTWWNIINFTDWVMYIERKTVGSHVTYQFYWCSLATDHPPLKPNSGHLPWFLLISAFLCFPCMCAKDGTTLQSCTCNLPLPQVPVDDVLLTVHSEWVTVCGWLCVSVCTCPSGQDFVTVSHLSGSAILTWCNNPTVYDNSVLLLCATQSKTTVIPTSDVSVRIDGRRDGTTILHLGTVGGGDVEGSPGSHLFSHMVNSQLANCSAPWLGPLLTGGWGQSETHFVLHGKKLHH